MLSRGTPFSSWASGYDASALQSVLYEPVHSAVMEQLNRHAPHAGRMLDVGCGTGRLLHAAAQQYPLVVGLDPCLDMLETGQRRGTQADHLSVCAMAELLPFATATFDIVTSTLSMRHWEDSMRGLGELTRVLSKSGTLVIADAVPYTWPQRRHRVRRRHRNGGHLRLMAMRCGLAVIDQRVAPSLFNVQVLTTRPR